MNTVLLSVVLSGALLAGQNPGPTWQTDYAKAQEISASQKKPIAVIFGAGSNGWAKVVREASPAPEVSRLLSSGYVCVYVDTATIVGKKLATDFSMSGNTGVVLSDRTGSVQAFWHQGDLTSQDLARYLQKYADPQIAVRATETANSVRTSFYPTEGGATSPFTEGSYCPNCQNVRGRR